MRKDKKEQSQMFRKEQEEGQQSVGPTEEKPVPSDRSETELFFGEKKFRTGLGILSIIFLVFMFVFETTITDDVAATEVKNRISTMIPAGYTLEADTNIQIASRDFEVTGFDGNGTARMLIWDYTGNSNNEVQILVDGQVVREVHMLNSNVAAYSVPVPSVVTIRGVNSSAGEPITYAVKFPDRKQTLFNLVPVNGVNQYTLVPRF